MKNQIVSFVQGLIIINASEGAVENALEVDIARNRIIVKVKDVEALTDKERHYLLAELGFTECVSKSAYAYYY